MVTCLDGLSGIGETVSGHGRGDYLWGVASLVGCAVSAVK